MSAGELRAWLAPIEPPGDATAFVLALLRDIYGDDEDVVQWLTRWRPELGGTAADVLELGRDAEVEALAVRCWNDGARTHRAAGHARTTARVRDCAVAAVTIALALFAPALPAQAPEVRAGIAEVLKYSAARNVASTDVNRMTQLWLRTQEPGLESVERQAAFRDLYIAYAKMQGRDVTARPEALDGSARFATTIFEGGGRMNLALPEPRGKPVGNYLHIETRGHGPTRLLLISDIGIDGRELYRSFAERQGSTYTMDVVTLPYAGAARPLPWPETLDYAAQPWLGQIERELLALIDQPHMKGVTVVGTAAGGYFAARLALLRPTRIKGAILVNALLKMPMRSPDNPSEAASMAQRLMVVKSVPPAPQLWPMAPIPADGELRRIISDSASRHPSVQNWMAFAVKDAALSRAWTFTALSGGFFLPSNAYRWELTTTDLTEAMKTLRVPLLAIGSRHDKGSPITTFPAITQWEELKLLYSNIPLKLVVFDETRSYASADAPAMFDRTLAAFLGEIPSARAGQARE